MENEIKEMIKSELEGNLLNSIQDIEEGGETQFECYDLEKITEPKRDFGVFDLELTDGDVVSIDWWLEPSPFVNNEEVVILTYEIEVF